MLCNKLRGPIKRTTTKVIAVTLGLTFKRVPGAGSRNAWKTRMDAIPDDSELADTRTPEPDPAVSNTCRRTNVRRGFRRCRHRGCAIDLNHWARQPTRHGATFRRWRK